MTDPARRPARIAVARPGAHLHAGSPAGRSSRWAIGCGTRRRSRCSPNRAPRGPRFGRTRADALLAGSLAALAGLCRTEWGLATLIRSASGSPFASGLPRRARGCGRRARRRSAPLSSGAPRSGLRGDRRRRAVLGDGQLLLTGLRRRPGSSSGRFSRIPRWPRGPARAPAFGKALDGRLFDRRRRDGAAGRPRGRGAGWPGSWDVSPAILSAGWAGAPEGSELFSVAPLACGVALGCGAAAPGRTASGGARRPSACSGCCLSFRRPFDIRDLGYVAPPLTFAARVRRGASEARRARGGGRSRSPPPPGGTPSRDGGLAVLLFARRFQFSAARRPGSDPRNGRRASRRAGLRVRDPGPRVRGRIEARPERRARRGPRGRRAQLPRQAP